MIVHSATEVRHRAVFELRYAMGYEYWDRAGKIINSLLSSQAASSWKFETIDTRATRLIDPETNLQFSFGPAKADLSHTQSADQDAILPPNEFAVLAEELTKIVLEIISPTSIERAGYRVWRLYGTRDKAEAEECVCDARLFRLPDDINGIAEASATLLLERPEHMIRAVVVSFEQSIEVPRHVFEAAKKDTKRLHRDQRAAIRDKYIARKAIRNYPHSGVLFDTDVFIEDPPYPESFNISDFILGAEEDVESIKSSILARRGANEH